MWGQLRHLIHFKQVTSVLVVAALGATIWASPSLAIKRATPAPSSLDAQINANTVAIVSGNINAAWLTLAYDLSAVLDDGNNFRVLPVIGKGGAQNVRDVRYLKGVDLGITVTSVLGDFRRSGELGNIADRIDYITRLSTDAMHVLVRADSNITSLAQLNGQKVNFSDLGSASEVSSKDVFGLLGIKPIEVNMGQSDAYQKIKSGEIAATIQFGASPAPAIAKLHAADGFRLLPVAYDKRLEQDYLPATLKSDDYPGVIAKGHDVDTIGYGAVMIAYNWPRNSDRYRRIAQFVDRFFSHFDEFQKPPRHPAWREVNLAADLPGWRRFPAAQEWLDSHRPATNAALPDEQAEFDQFLAQRAGGSSALVTPEQREQLFREYQNWRSKSPRPPNSGN